MFTVRWRNSTPAARLRPRIRFLQPDLEAWTGTKRVRATTTSKAAATGENVVIADADPQPREVRAAFVCDLWKAAELNSAARLFRHRFPNHPDMRRLPATTVGTP